MSDVRKLRSTKKTKPHIDTITNDVIEEMCKDYNDKKFTSLFDINNYDITDIKDLIKIGIHWKKTKKRKRSTQDIELYKLYRIIPYLIELDNMVGMEELKNSLVYQILFYIQNLHTNEMMHTVITGDPGVGKTTVAQIIGRIYTELGFLSKGTFRITERKDFVGQYLGETAIKTSKLLQSCIGGVLFIDEAYSLGHKEHRDSYSKEAMDTLNKFLSEHTKDFVCIVAGYQDDLNSCFFSANPGLSRRFPWRYNIKPYNGQDLHEIFLRQVKNNHWCIHKNKVLTDALFIDNIKYFQHNGGDTLTFFEKCKMMHAKRVFGKNIKNKFFIAEEDIEKGMRLHKEIWDSKEIKEDHTKLFAMYS